jgi:GT2 family glycosyltransferase
MIRPAVSVVVPFAGDPEVAWAAVEMLQALDTTPRDELILADNSGVAIGDPGPVRIVRAGGERSPAHARNTGATATESGAEWILFLDADVRAPAGLLDAYFADAVDSRVGALVGEIRPATGGPGTLAARYGAARNFLGQQAHMAHPFRPRAAAANLLVRRAAFEAAGGFAEGVRAAEDTDFCWRLQDLGWTLELRPDAVVEHEYRETVGELRRQWRSYASGRAWLARRYPGFTPEPAITRAFARMRDRARVRLRGRLSARRAPGPPAPARAPAPAAGSRDIGERLAFLALDVLLAGDELIGLRMSNDVRGPRR